MFILGVVPSDSKFAAIEIAPGRLTPVVRLRGRSWVSFFIFTLGFMAKPNTLGNGISD